MSAELFVKINRQILIDQDRQAFVNFCLSNLDRFEKFPSRKYPGQFSGNDFLWANNMPAEINARCRQVLDLFDIPFRYEFAKQDPGCNVLRHTDLRTAVIIIPLYPYTDFESTMFWNDEDSAEPMCRCDYSDMLPALLNPRVLHSIHNKTNDYRLALQLDFELSYDQVKTLLDSRGLLVK